jgi:hypothetical protein
MYKAVLLSFFCVLPCHSADNASEGFWPAGRYDGDRIVVYFEAVKFGTNFPVSEPKLAPPVASAFFSPMALTSKDIQRFDPQFAIGDQYGLLLGNNDSVTVTLTQLVYSPGDEGVGNFSYIGVLAKVNQENGLPFQGDYYVVTKHRDPGSVALLRSAPVQLNIQNQIAAKLKSRLSDLSVLQVQSFTLADGSPRYYARAESASGKALSAWLSPDPSLHVLAFQDQTSKYGFNSETPELLNVIDLGRGRTGIIVSTTGEDSQGLFLLEYRDGPFQAMRKLFLISAAE